MNSHSFFPDFSNPMTYVSILTITFLEIVLGIDNIIFVSIVASKLPAKEQPRARNIGLMLALFLRMMLLLVIGWVLSLNKPLFEIPFVKDHTGLPMGISWKDLILIGGGLFLLYKSSDEIHHKLEGKSDEVKSNEKSKMSAVIMQIMLVNLVFSFDSILTAIGMTPYVFNMMVAVIFSILAMMLFSNAVSHFINTHPTMQMLALSFLILIGVMLIAKGFHQEVNDGYIYFSIAFSLGVELLNMKFRKKNVGSGEQVKLAAKYKDSADGVAE
jgi:predicted tellurium resistance membrane protein TerC